MNSNLISIVKRTKILVVDDEKDIVDLIAYNLTNEGFAIVKAYDGDQAQKLIQAEKPDLVLLDLMLPGLQGLEICKRVRTNPETASVPIIMLTAKTEEIDKILGLEMGADDYITKPFSVRELIARVRAIMRRTNPPPANGISEIFSHNGLQVNYRSYEVSLDGNKLDLSPTEIKLLMFFTKNPGRVFTRDQILDHVWGNDSFVEPRTVDVHIRRLRSQLEKDSENPEFIQTVRGVGYKFIK
jgi:phosphate regulon transcriptional regulator PhoB